MTEAKEEQERPIERKGKGVSYPFTGYLRDSRLVMPII